jgi:hypothetical protein
MVIVGLLAVLAVLAVALLLAVLTALGAHARGQSIALSAVAGAFFPVTWAVWYVRDEHPYRKVHGRAA